MSIIETEIWEPSNDKKGTVTYVGQRKVKDVFNELCTYLKKEHIYPDDYLLLNSDFNKNELMPRILDLFCYAHWGGSEGVYLEVIFIIKKDDKTYDRVIFATGKTLGETSEDYDRMQYIAGRIYKAFTGEGSKETVDSADIDISQNNRPTKLTKQEIYSAIHNIEDKYGLFCFRCALTHLLSCGQKTLLNIEKIKKTKTELMLTVPKNSILSADFQCDIIDCASELARFNSYDLFRYIKTNVSTGDWNNEDI